jgi:hypothetical protein
MTPIEYSEIDMFGPIFGAGWSAPEIVSGASFRWMHGSIAHLVLPALGGGHLRIIWFLWAFPTPEQLSEVKLRVGPDPIPVRWEQHGRVISLVIDTVRPVGEVSFRLDIDCPTLPSDDSTSVPRALAVSRVEVWSLGRKHDDASATLVRQQNEIEALRRSTSWRLTAPLRWARRLLG